jgi:hypothetical protein
MPININDPLGFATGYDGTLNWWGAAQTYPNGDEFGATGTNGGLNAGEFNTADNWFGIPTTTFTGQGLFPHVEPNASLSPFNNGVSGYTVGPNGFYNGVPNPGNTDLGNNGDGDGYDTLGDVTVINTAVGYNPTFAADNVFFGAGSIGLYGRSRGLGTTPTLPAPAVPPSAGHVPGNNDWSIGVLGQSSKGCGIYGLATDENPLTFPVGTDRQPSHGIGVVGRSIGGAAAEGSSPPESSSPGQLGFSVEQMMGQTTQGPGPAGGAVQNDGAIGVLGHSLNGPGVRGHGGPLLLTLVTPTDPGTPPVPEVPVPFEIGGLNLSVNVVTINPGGVFSSGRREYIPVNSNNLSAKGLNPDLLQQEVSPDSFPQLRLAPSIGPKLPEIGRIGDLFMQLGTNANDQAAAQLWICTGYSSEFPTLVMWSPVTMGAPLEGGRTPPAIP